MTTRAERADHIAVHIVRMVKEWADKTGRPGDEALNDPRTKEAMSLLVDVMGDIEEVGDDDTIEDVAFISENDDDKG